MALCCAIQRRLPSQDRDLHFPSCRGCWEQTAISELLQRRLFFKEDCLTYAHISFLGKVYIQCLVRELKARPPSPTWDVNAEPFQLQGKPWTGWGLGHECITVQFWRLLIPSHSHKSLSWDHYLSGNLTCDRWCIRNGLKHDLNIRFWSWIICKPINNNNLYHWWWSMDRP